MESFLTEAIFHVVFVEIEHSRDVMQCNSNNFRLITIVQPTTQRRYIAWQGQGFGWKEGVGFFFATIPVARSSPLSILNA